MKVRKNIQLHDATVKGNLGVKYNFVLFTYPGCRQGQGRFLFAWKFSFNKLVPYFLSVLAKRGIMAMCVRPTAGGQVPLSFTRDPAGSEQVWRPHLGAQGTLSSGQGQTLQSLRAL